MDFLGTSNCIALLSEHIATHTDMRLQDPRASNWPSVINGPLFIDRAYNWAKIFFIAEPVKNSPILILMRLGVESSNLLLGALQAGLFPILMKPTIPTHLVLEAVRESSCSLVAVPSGLLLEIVKHGFLPVSQGDDYAILRSPYASVPHLKLGNTPIIGILSSGSTGKPKVIIHTLDRVLHNATLHATSIGLRAEDTVALTLPLNFSAGLVAGLLSTLITGASGIFIDAQKINPRRLLPQLHVSVCMATPATIMSVYDTTTLDRARVVTVGGDTINYRLACELIEYCGRATEVYSTYGMTEAGPRISSSTVTREILEHYNAIPLGKPLEGVQLDIRTTDTVAGSGELLVSTPTAMYGYLNPSLESSTTQDKPFGTIRTGDIFKVLSDGLVFVGRSGRLIVRGGENIYPAVIESAILKHLDIDDVWVTAEPDELLGHVPKAYIIGNRKIESSYMAKKLRQVLPSSYIPAIWEYAEKLPDHAKK